MANEAVKDDKKVEFLLRDYQKDTSENINEIYNREEHNRFAGVIIPTGGGKSFIAIDQLLSFNNENYAEKERNGEINGTSMLYVAPSHEILSQVKMHIVKKLIFNIPNLENMTLDEINDLIRTDFPSLNFKGINSGVKLENQISDNASKSEKINAIVKQIEPKQITELVRKAFPNLKFRCYAGIKGEKEEYDPTEEITDDDIVNSEFIILDEAHRLGASEWGPRFASSLKKNTKAKVLAITATPERKEGQDMMATIARMVYPNEIVTPDEYIAKEIYVVDAVKDGIVNSPDVIECDSALADSIQYETVLKLYEKSKDKQKEELGRILDEMEALIGFSPRKMTKEEVEKAKEEDIKRTISQNIKNKNGKYIAFINNNETKNGVKKSPEEFFREQIDSIKKRFEGVLDENGNPVKVSVYFVSSETSIKINEDGYPVDPDEDGKRIDNSSTIKAFEDESNSTGGIKILLSNKMLDEGVHVDGIDGAIMFRNVNSSTTYLQEAGRCISSLDPEKPFYEQSKTQLIDVRGNTFKQINSNIGQKFSYRYDLEKIKEIRKWIEENDGKIPEVNKKTPKDVSEQEKVKAEKEARYAITLKRLKFRYSRYRSAKNLPVDSEEVISKILNNANNIDLWNINIPPRTIEPFEDELSGNGFLETMTPTQEKFMKLYDEAVQKTRKILTNDKRISKLLHILSVLKTYSKDLKFPQGISINTETKAIPELCSSDLESLSLEDFLKANLKPEQVKEAFVILQDPVLMGARSRSEMYYPGEHYDLGKEIAFVRGKLWTSQYDFSKDNDSCFDDYTLSDLIEIGLIRDGKDDLQKIGDMFYEFTKATTKCSSRLNTDYFIDEQGRLKKELSLFDRFFDMHIGLIDKFEECSLFNGERFFEGYDRDGYDKYGYDIFGYNRLGFDRNNVHKDTGNQYDQRGFYYDSKKGQWLNRYSNSEYDLLGYNIYGFNEDGFERPRGMCGHAKFHIPKWHRRREDGTYESHGYFMRPKRVGIDNDVSCDAHDFTGKSRGNTCDRNYRAKPKAETNPEGFYSYGGRRKKPKINSKAPLINDDFYDKRGEDGVDIDGYDRNNFKEVVVNGKKKFIHRDTSCEYDKQGYRCVIKNNKKVYECDQSITISKDVIMLMLESNKNFDEICEIYSRQFKVTKSEIDTQLKYVLDKAFEIFDTSSPNAFDVRKKEREFKGLNEYYFSNSNSSEKRERLNEFFEVCPRAKDIVKRESKENERKLEILEGKKQIGKLTTQEESMVKSFREYKERYDSIDFDDR